MTKLEKLKAEIGYTRERSCQECQHYSSEITKGKYYSKESNIRCGLYGFKVHKTAVCNSWVHK